MRKHLSIAVVCALLTTALSAFVPVSAGASADGVQCEPESIPVALSSLNPATYNISGTLCWRGNLEGKTMQLLVHGFTYDRNYWDFPYQSPNYSYVASATQAGYATFAVDRLGAGLSDHPEPELLTVPAEAYTIHQIIQNLRAGSIGGVAFAKVILVGHSLGSMIGYNEVATYDDVQGFIATGEMHTLAVGGGLNILATIYPAALDPKFANENLPLGYVTTEPGTRGGDFYNAADADPDVIALDEQLKQTGADSEQATFITGIDPLLSLAIHVPVMVAVGSDDTSFCGLGASCADSATITSREAPFFSASACMEGYALPNSGHDMNLHLNAQTWYNAASDWANRRVGPNDTTPPTQPCN